MIRLNLTRPCADPRCPACAPAPARPPVTVADGVDVARWLRAAIQAGIDRENAG